MYTWRHYAEMTLGGPIPTDKAAAYEALFLQTYSLQVFLHRFVPQDVNLRNPWRELDGYIARSSLPPSDASNFVMHILRAVPAPGLPHFAGPIHQGNGLLSLYQCRQAVAMLWECYALVSGFQQTSDHFGDQGKGRVRALLREIVRSVTGEEIEFFDAGSSSSPTA